MAPRKPRPKTGEPRQVNQPMKIDRLPPDVQDGIIRMRNGLGKTWEEIEDLSALPKDKGGFIDWEALPTPVLELFPDMRLPKSNLHRWYAQRVELVRKQTLERSQIAREVAGAFAAANVEGDQGASINALRDVIFGMLSEADDVGTRSFLAKGLEKLANVQQKARLNDLRSKKLDADLARSEAQKARYEAEAGDPRQIYMLAAQDLLKKLRTRAAVRSVLEPIQNELINEISHAAEAFAKQVEQATA